MMDGEARERACSAKYYSQKSEEEEGKWASSAKYNTHYDERACPAKYSYDGDDSESASDCTTSDSDPDAEQIILNLMDREITFNNPFHLSDHVREVLKAQAEWIGARARLWRLGDFNRIGGPNMLRELWAELKYEHKVAGVKRNVSENE